MSLSPFVSSLLVAVAVSAGPKPSPGAETTKVRATGATKVRATGATQVRATGPTKVRATGLTVALPVRNVIVSLGRPVKLTKTERAQVAEVVGALKTGGDVNTPPAQWAPLVQAWSERTHAKDTQALVQLVIRQSYLESSEDLAARADKVAYFNEAKRELRASIKRARKLLAAAKAGETIAIRPVSLRKAYTPKTRAVALGASRKLSPAEVEALIASWEQQLQSIGDDTQLAQLQLQDTLQKQQQTLQTISNVSKMLSDTAKAIIDNMR